MVVVGHCRLSVVIGRHRHGRRLRWAKTRVLKNGHASVETRVLKNAKRVEKVSEASLSIGRQRVGAF